MRGGVRELEGGTPLIATVHPSFLLRIEGHGDVAQEYGRFVADLAAARPYVVESSRAAGDD
jgi:DNA polymerase